LPSRHKRRVRRLAPIIAQLATRQTEREGLLAQIAQLKGAGQAKFAHGPQQVNTHAGPAVEGSRLAFQSLASETNCLPSGCRAERAVKDVQHGVAVSHCIASSRVRNTANGT
jgi:hypothetical protein